MHRCNVYNNIAYNDISDKIVNNYLSELHMILVLKDPFLFCFLYVVSKTFSLYCFE